MIQLQDVEFRYPHSQVQLSIPSLTVPHSKWAVVIGPSGCGKTTFLNLVAGILKPNKGQVQVDGFSLEKANTRQSRNFRISKIGFVFQNFELIEYLNVEQNILYPFYLNSSLKLDPSVYQIQNELVEQLSLEGRKKKAYPYQLSQGEKQRVCIARALITSPALVIADEPTGNLDPETTLQVLQLLEKICKSRETTLLMVTRDHSLLEKFDVVFQAKDWRKSA